MGHKHTVALAPAALIMIASSPATAQTITGGYELRSTNVVSPSQPTTEVEIWAWWDDSSVEQQVFGAGNLDLVAESGEFLAAWGILQGCGASGCNYVFVGSRVNGLHSGQLHLPTLGIYGNPDNPIHLLTAVWTTTDFTAARTVDLWTENTNTFLVADGATGATTQLYPGGFIPGTGAIQVIPAPAASWVVLAITLGSTRRRRITARNSD